MASVPADAELGVRDLLLRAEYSDFRGVRHEENITISVQVAGMGSFLSLTLEPYEARVIDTVNASVTLVDELGRPLANMSVDLYVDDIFITSAITDENGTAELSFQADLSPGLHVVRAIFNGTTLVGASSAEAQLFIRLRNSSLEAEAPSEATSGTPFVVRGVLKGEDGEPIENATIRLYIVKDGSLELLAESKTDASGVASFSIALEAGEHHLKLIFEGNDVYAGSEATFSIIIKPKEGQSGGGGLQGMGDVLVPALAVGAAISASAIVAIRLRKHRS